MVSTVLQQWNRTRFQFKSELRHIKLSFSSPQHPTINNKFISRKSPLEQLQIHNNFISINKLKETTVKMTVLTPSPNPSTSLSTSQNHLLTILSHPLTNSLYLASIFQQLLSTTTLFILFRAYILTLLLFRQSFSTTQILLVQAYYTVALLTKQLVNASKQAIKLGWKATERFRNKLFFEFMVFILGGGNGLLLVILWPGWIVLGGAAWSIWTVCG